GRAVAELRGETRGEQLEAVVVRIRRTRACRDLRRRRVLAVRLEQHREPRERARVVGVVLQHPAAARDGGVAVAGPVLEARELQGALVVERLAGERVELAARRGDVTALQLGL